MDGLKPILTNPRLPPKRLLAFSEALAYLQAQGEMFGLLGEISESIPQGLKPPLVPSRLRHD